MRVAVYSMTGYANASASAPTAPAAALHEAPRGSAGTAAVAARRRRRDPLGQRPLSRPRAAPARRAARPRAGAARRMLTARFKRGKIELRLTGAAAPRATCPSRRPSSSPTSRASTPACASTCRMRARSRCTRRCSGAAARPTTQPEHAVLAAAERCVERPGRGARARRRAARGRAGRARRPSARARRRGRAARAGRRRAHAAALPRALERGARQGRRGASVTREAIEERALNEAAAYAIRIDVAEELARLRSHLDEIARLLDKGGEIGKRLEFLIQELLREANTLGSKSPSIEMTAISVDMKVAIEQLREQVQNVE